MSAPDVQGAGRAMLLSLHMLSKSVRMYSTDNAIFQKPLQSLLEQLNGLVQRSGRADVVLAGPALYVNGELVRVDAGHVDGLRQLAQLFESYGIGGLALKSPVSLGDLRSLFEIFKREPPRTASDGPPDAALDGLPGHPLGAIKLVPWNAHREQVAKDVEGGDSETLRAARRLAIYARTLVWELHQENLYRQGRVPAFDGLGRISQELVESCHGFGPGMLAILLNGAGPTAAAYHRVNAAIIGAVFARRLGLSRPATRDLVGAALTFGLSGPGLPAELWLGHEPLSAVADKTGQRRRALSEAAGLALRGQATSALHQARAMLPLQAAADTATTGLGGPGRALLQSQVLAIAMHYDALTAPAGQRPALGIEQALGTLWGPQRSHFDGELVDVFVHVMAALPLKVAPRRAGGVFD